MKKTVILAMFLTVCLTGCAGIKEDTVRTADTKETVKVEESKEPAEDNTAEDEATNENTTEAESAVNNGGLYVEYRGVTYYRQYQADSYAETGLFCSYDPIPDSMKTMMMLENGKDPAEAKEAFQDAGDGNIYIWNDRMYLQKYTQNGQTVYSVKLDGSDYKEIGTGRMEGLDEENGILVCTLADENEMYQLQTYDMKSGTINNCTLENPCTKVLKVEDGVIYYEGEAEYEKAQAGEVRLCSVNSDGSGDKLLAVTSGDLYEFPDAPCEITCFQIAGEQIYFSYGAYGGTGHFYQGGKIAAVNKDGSGFETLQISPLADGSGDFTTVDENFYVEQGADGTLVHFSQIMEEVKGYVLNVKTGEVQEAQNIMGPEGEAVEKDGKIILSGNWESGEEELISEISYDTLGEKAEADQYYIQDVQTCGEYVYFRLERSTYTEEVSIGWRDGYTRAKTQVMRTLKGSSVKDGELIYEY